MSMNCIGYTDSVLVITNSKYIRMDEKQDTPPSMPGTDLVIEPLPDNIPERKKTEKRIVVDEEVEEAKQHPETPRKKKKLKGIKHTLILRYASILDHYVTFFFFFDFIAINNNVF